MPDFGRTLLLISTCLALAACGSPGSNRNADPDTPIPNTEYKRGNWFCQANAARDDWDCTQDPRLTTNPIPARLQKLSQLEPAEIATAQSLDAPDWRTPEPRQVATEPGNAVLTNTGGRTAAPAPPPQPAPAPQSAPVLEQNPQAAEPPDWQRVAYRPATASALGELPAHFYAVQIVAMSSMEALESFQHEHQLGGILAARVEADGAVYYVLLLGIYETLADAKAAAASRPESLMAVNPWIRKLGPLQAAVRRADMVADRTQY